jgi:hypothetical protein
MEREAVEHPSSHSESLQRAVSVASGTRQESTSLSLSLSPSARPKLVGPPGPRAGRAEHPSPRSQTAPLTSFAAEGYRKRSKARKRPSAGPKPAGPSGPRAGRDSKRARPASLRRP